MKRFRVVIAIALSLSLVFGTAGIGAAETFATNETGGNAEVPVSEEAAAMVENSDYVNLNFQ